MFFKKKKPKEPITHTQVALTLGIMLGIGMTMAVTGLAVGMDNVWELYVTGEPTQPSLAGILIAFCFMMPLGLAFAGFVYKFGYQKMDEIVEDRNRKAAEEAAKYAIECAK